jgi:hypothetical protein
MPDELSNPEEESKPEEEWTRPVVQRSIAIGLAAGAFIVGVAVASIIAVIVSVSGGNGSANSPTSTVPVQFSIVPPTTAKAREVPPAGGVGQPVVNGGIKLTVNAVTTPPNITRRFESDGLLPRAGAKYVQVETTVENVGTKSIDLSCGHPIANKVWDSLRRQFDAIDKIYDIAGNPDCPVNLQPGFSAKMTYAYEVPQDAVIQYFGFADTSVDMGNNASFITIGA